MTTRTNIFILSAALGLSIAAGGCVVRSSGAYSAGYSTGYVEQPNLVYVSPGVWVVENYNEPVFWHGDYYWAYRHGVWYRSTTYAGGWVRVHVVPTYVRRIHHPRRYVHYRAPRGVRTRPAPRVRDHRAPPPRRAHPPARTYQPRRDHRTYQPPRRNERVPARRAAPPRGGSRPGVNRTYGGTRKNAPPPRRKPTKSKSRSRDHR